MQFQDAIEPLMQEAAVEAHLPALHIAARLAAAVVVGWVLSAVYRRTHAQRTVASAIPHTQMLLAVGGALIWLVVGDNLVRAFGLAGTIGLIRYRTRIRDPKDTTVLLFSMILGMACGIGQFVVAALGLVFVVAVMFWLSWSSRPEEAGAISRDQALQDLMDLDTDANSDA